MSFLRDFGAGLFTGIGNQLQQREDEERRMQIEEALAKRRLAWQTQMENKINPRQPEPYGVPVQRGPGNWAQPTQQYVPPEFDPETYDVTKPASYVPGPDIPAQDPTALSPKDAAMQDYRERQLALQKELGEGRNAALRTRGNSADRPMGEAERRRLELQERRENRLSQGGVEDSAPASSTKYSKAFEAERTRAARWADAQMKRFEKMDPAKALSTIKSETGVTAPTLPAYRELLIQQAMAPWEKENPAPKSEGAVPKSEGLQDPPPELLDEAKAAIAQGKSRAAVIQRLKENGYSSKGL